MNISPKAIRRILKDLKENERFPIDGISVCMPNEDDIFTLHGNVRVEYGPYKGMVFHLIFHMPRNYPHVGPAANIAPGIPFDQRYHEHLFQDGVNGSSICNDMLTNFQNWFRDIDGDEIIASGWSSGYTLNVILMQLQPFFADPDLPENRLPTEEMINKLRESLDKFECKECGHTTKKPYPPIENNNDKVDEKKQEKTPEEIEKEKIAEKLVCATSKLGIDDEDTVLGYPLFLKKDKYGRLWPEPILELMSYETYMHHVMSYGADKLDNYDTTFFKSVNGERWNHWIPCYFTKEHYERGKTIVLNAMSVIRHGVHGTEENDFTPQMVLHVMPVLMNNCVVSMMKGNMYESTKAIEAYCHFLRLFMALIDEFPEVKKTINEKVEKFMNKPDERHKLNTPNLGEFLIITSLSDHNYDENLSLKVSIVREFFTRQIYWIRKKVKFTKRPTDAEFLQRYFDASKVANHLLVFNLEATRYFIFPKFKEFIDARSGFPPEHIVKSFQERIKKIKNEVTDYRIMVAAIGCTKWIKTEQKMCEVLENARWASRQCKYDNNAFRHQKKKKRRKNPEF